VQGQRLHATSAFLKEALDQGRNSLNGAKGSRAPRSGSVPKCAASASRSVVLSVARSASMDSDHQARWPNQLPIWNRQPGDGIGDRRSPCGRRGFGGSVGEVRRYLGRLVEQPSVHLRFRRQPDDPCNDTRGARHRDGRQEEAPGKSRRRNSAAIQRLTKSPTSAYSAEVVAPA